MPRPRRLSRFRVAGGLTPFQHARLLDRELPEPTADDTWWDICERGAADVASAHHARSAVALWRQHRDALMAEWLREHPGRRPAIWWDSDAPRAPPGRYPGCRHDGQLPLARERLGGVGTPAHEVLAVAPWFAYGIPVVWLTAGDLRIWPRLGAPAFDPADPPVYEAQAAYLERHGLLLPGERARLTAADLEPEAVPRDAAPDTPPPAPGFCGDYRGGRVGC
jgi:hypothetical protein